MQGKGLNCSFAKRISGITPAYAGKSLTAGSDRTYLQDHPCVCREKLTTVPNEFWNEGSPLRMQGKAVLFIYISHSFRITPAYAGKSRAKFKENALSEDHPCVCREKRCRLVVLFHGLGSPLRMQGKVKNLCSLLKIQRITPAYAGKSIGLASERRQQQDHPCVCREKYDTVPPGHASRGSPLRMQGKDLQALKRSTCFRITPAYAGKRLIFLFI